MNNFITLRVQPRAEALRLTTMSSSSKKLLLPVRGSYYYATDTLDALGRIQPHNTLSLIPEPTNEFDINAIQIWTTEPDEKQLLGYISRVKAPFINQLIANQRIQKVEVATCYRQYERLYLYIHIHYQPRWSDILQRIWLRLRAKPQP